MTALRIQMRSAPPNSFRVGFENGWHCGHWHPTPEDALRCVRKAQAPARRKPNAPRLAPTLADELTRIRARARKAQEGQFMRRALGQTGRNAR